MKWEKKKKAIEIKLGEINFILMVLFWKVIISVYYGLAPIVFAHSLGLKGKKSHTATEL